MRYTREDLVNIVKNDQLIYDLGYTETSIRTGINSLITQFVEFGMVYLEEPPKDRGMWIHYYEREDLMKYLSEYLGKVKNHRLNLRKRVAMLLLDHFKFIETGLLKAERESKDYSAEAVLDRIGKVIKGSIKMKKKLDIITEFVKEYETNK